MKSSQGILKYYMSSEFLLVDSDTMPCAIVSLDIQ